MIVITQLIAVYIAAMGIMFIFKPDALKPYAAFWEKKRRLYIIGGQRIIMGMLLFLAASSCRLKLIVVAIGVLLVVAGLPYFLIPLERLKSMVERWQNRSTSIVRLLGLAILLIGLLLIWAA